MRISQIALFLPAALLSAQPQCENGGCSAVPSLQQSQVSTSAVSNLTLFKNYALNGDYTVAGVGVRGVGSGTIQVTAIPSGAQVTAAYLYWETLGNGQTGMFNGRPIQGVPLGTVTSPCWAPPLIVVYRADVKAYLNPGGNGAYSVKFPDSGNFSIAPSTEGASVIIVYNRPDLPSKGIVIYDGAYTQGPGTPTFDLTLSGFGTVGSTSTAAKMTHVVGDGQPFTETLSINNVVVGSPTNPFGGAQGSLWDNLTFDISSLVLPGTTSVTTSVRWPPNSSNDCLTWGAVALSTSVDTGSGSVEILDPVSELLSGPRVITPTTSSNIATLASKGIPRTGLATDGAAKLVLRFNAPSAGSATFILTDESGVIVSDTGLYGSLTDLFGQPLSGIVSIPTLPTGQGSKVWALYSSPLQFARNPTDADIAQRSIFVRIHFVPTSGAPQDLKPIPVRLVRPPIMLVHGLWESEADWSGLFPLSSRDCADSNNTYICRLDYRDHHADKFAVIADIIGPQIRDNISHFRTAKSVAAVRANIIGHSLGGVIPRVLPQCGPTSQFTDCSFAYTTAENYNAGYIYRSVTIGSPHQGSPLADHLWTHRDTKCCFSETLCGTLGSHFAAKGNPIGGGVEDLQTTSGALAGLNASTTPFYQSFFVGIANSNDEALFNSGLIDAVRSCNTGIVPANGRDVFGQDSDLIVSVSSQRYGLADGATGTATYSPTIHSPGIVWTGQTGYSVDEYHLTTLAHDAIKLLDLGVFVNK